MEDKRYPLAQYMQSKYEITYKFVGITLHKDWAVEKVTQVYSKKLIEKSSEFYFFLPASYLNMWLMQSPHSCSIYYWLGTDLFSARNLQKYSISQNVISMTDGNFPSK